MDLQDNWRFQLHDYIVFGVFSAIGASIALYFTFYNSKQKTSINDYLVGGKNLKTVPIGFSLTSSMVSAVLFAAFPNEVYRYGWALVLTPITIIAYLIVNYLLVLPVFYNLPITSVTEYIGLRFNKNVQKIVSVFFVIYILKIMACILYVAAISLAQGTGLSLGNCAVIVCVICTFYTAVGGIKAIVSTDVLQFFVILTVGGTVIYFGTTSAGFTKVWNDSVAGHRINFDIGFDLMDRDTILSMLIGHGMHWGQFLIFNQSVVQKCLAVSSMEKVKMALVICGICLTSVYCMIIWLGLLIYTEYQDCDPVLSKKIRVYDQLFSFYILDKIRHVYWLPGIFLYGVISAAISTLSAGMNALSCTIYKDFISLAIPESLSQWKSKLVIRFIVVVVGVVCVLMTFVLEYFGTAVVVSYSLTGITSGPISGLFYLGLFFRKANCKGAIYGMFGSLAIMAWIVIGSQYYQLKKYIIYETKPISIAGCDHPFNISQTNTMAQDLSWQPLFVYKIPFYYYSVLGSVLVVLIGISVSFLDKSEKESNEELLSPCIRRKNEVYVSVDTNPKLF